MIVGDINVFIGDYQIEDLRLDLGCTPLQSRSKLKAAAASAKRAARSLFFLLLPAPSAFRPLWVPP